MALINYKPTEGMTARVAGAICVLALGLLGCWQLHGFLAGVGGKSLGSEDELLELTRLEALIENRQSIFEELGKWEIEVSQKELSLPTRTILENAFSLSLDTSDPEAKAKVDEVERNLVAGGYQTATPIDRRTYIGEGGLPLTAADIQRIYKSRVPPAKVTVMGEPKPMSLEKIEAQLGKELFAVGAMAPFPDLGVRVSVSLQVARMKANNVRVQWTTQRFPEEGIVLAEQIAADVDRKIPELLEGTPLADVVAHLSKMGVDILAIRHETPGELVEVPWSVVEPDSVLGKALFEATLIKLEENIIVGGRVVVAGGTNLAKTHVDALEAEGIASVLVKIDKISLEPGTAVGLEPVSPIETFIAAGQRITPDLITLVRRSHDDDFEVRVANTQERLSGDGPEEELRQRLAGRVVTAAKVMPESKMLADKGVGDPAKQTVTLGDYWHRLEEFNKNYDEDARWRQSISLRPLLVRPSGEAESVSVNATTKREDLVDYLLLEPIHDATTGEEMFPKGTVTTLLDAHQIVLSITSPTTPTAQFLAWKVERLSEGQLETYGDGPDQSFKFKEFKGEDGTVFIQDGESYTSQELLDHSRIDDIAFALDDTDLWLRVETQDGGIARRKLTWFAGDLDKWQKVLVLEESIEVDVPRVVVKAGTTLDDASIDEILKLPEGERGVIVRGQCATSKVSDLLPDTFETCEEPLSVTLAADRSLSQAAVDLLVEAGVPLVELKGGSRTVPTAEILDLIGKGASVQALISVKVGGEQIAAKGAELDRDLLDVCRSKDITELTVSGTKVEKALDDLEPGDIAAEKEGIQIVEAFEFQGEEVGRNTEVTEDLILGLAELRDTGELAFPFSLETIDSENEDKIEIESDDEWGKLAEAIPVSYYLKEPISLKGPLSKSFLDVGTAFSATWAGVMAFAVLAILMFAIVKAVNHQWLSDLLIDTQSEMQKVSWPTREDVLGSSQVVIFTVVCLAVFMLLADVVLDWVIAFILHPTPGPK